MNIKIKYPSRKLAYHFLDLKDDILGSSEPAYKDAMIYRVSFEHSSNTHRIFWQIEGITCEEFGGLELILHSSLLPGITCTVSWISGISSASSFSDLIASSL